MNQSLVALDALQEVDTAIARTERAFRALDSGKAEAAQYLEVKRVHDEATAVLHEIEANRRDAELQLEAVEEKKRDHEAKLYSGKVSNPKELDAMQHEIEALGRQRSRLDEKILGLMDSDESQQKVVAELAARMERLDAQRKAKAGKYVEEARKLQARMAKLTALRAERAADIPLPLLKRYDALRTAKNGIGLARIKDGRCGACNTSLPTRTIMQVRDTDGLLACESCGRLLCIHSESAS